MYFPRKKLVDTAKNQCGSVKQFSGETSSDEIGRSVASNDS